MPGPGRVTVRPLIHLIDGRSGDSEMAHYSTGTGQIYYEFHRGDDRLPCVLLIHGFGMNVRAWDTTTARLIAAGYPVLLADQRCCGTSDKDFADVTISTQAEDLVEICNEWNLERVVANGWSLGGAIAVQVAAMLGSRAAGLVLTGGATPRYTQADGFPFGGTPEDIRGMVNALQADRATFLRGLYFDGVFVRDVGEAVKTWCWHLALQESPAGDAALLDLARIDQREIMGDLSCPALIIHGAEDGVVPIEIGRYAAEQLQKGAIHEISDCGHAPFLEAPDEYHGALMSFLEGLPR